MNRIQSMPNDITVFGTANMLTSPAYALAPEASGSLFQFQTILLEFAIRKL